MASLLKNIAEPYSKDKVYNTKDMVLYNNLLYLCIYNNVSGEFNSSKWIEVQLTDLVQGKLRGIEDYSGKVIDASYVEQDDNYTYFGVPQKAFVDNETSFRTLNSNLANIKNVKFVIHTYPFNGYGAISVTAYKNDEVILQVSTQSNFDQIEILKTFKCKYAVNGYRWSIIPLTPLTYNDVIYTTSNIDCDLYNVDSTIEIFADVCL